MSISLTPSRPRSRDRRFQWGIMAAAGVLALAACGGSSSEPTAVVDEDASPEWQKVIEAAQEEGEVTIYTSQLEDQVKQMAADFTDRYGIKVNVYRGPDADINQKIEAEHNADSEIADVWVDASLTTMTSKPFDEWFVPAIGPAFDEPDYDRAALYPEGQPFAVGASVGTFAWNTDEVPDGLDDYEDILEPDFANGRIGMNEASAPAVMSFYTYLEDHYGSDFLDRLAEQEPRLYPSALVQTQALAAGEIAVTLAVQPQGPQKELGAPVDSGVPSAKFWNVLYRGSILKEAPNPNAAQLLVNYMVTREGQEAVNANQGAVLPDIPGTAAGADQLADVDVSSISTDEFAKFQARFKDLFVD